MFFGPAKSQPKNRKKTRLWCQKSNQCSVGGHVGRVDLACAGDGSASVLYALPAQLFPRCFLIASAHIRKHVRIHETTRNNPKLNPNRSKIGYRQTWPDAPRYRQIPSHTATYGRIQPDTASYHQILPVSTRYPQIQPDTRIPQDTTRYHQMPQRYQQIPPDATRHRLIPPATTRHPQSPDARPCKRRPRVMGITQVTLWWCSLVGAYGYPANVVLAS